MRDEEYRPGDNQASPPMSRRQGSNLADRLDDLRRTLQTLRAGAADIPPPVAEVAGRRLENEIEMLLSSDGELTAVLGSLRDMPAIIGCSVRSAAASEIARRSTLSAHRRIAEARERGC